jgi:hypothetical protein
MKGMAMKRRLLVTIGLALVMAAVALAADDPFVGTWKLNIGKSKLSGLTPPRSSTLVTKATDNGLQEINDSVDVNGQAHHGDRSYIADGKDHPVTGNPTVDAYNLTRIPPHTTVYVVKKGTEEIAKWRNTVSKDGKTLTRVLIQGQNSGRTLIYDKQ